MPVLELRGTLAMTGLLGSRLRRRKRHDTKEVTSKVFPLTRPNLNTHNHVQQYNAGKKKSILKKKKKVLVARDSDFYFQMLCSDKCFSVIVVG